MNDYGDEDVFETFKPKIASVIEFGHKGSEWDSVYPSKKELKELPLGDKIKLCRIRYKCTKYADY